MCNVSIKGEDIKLNLGKYYYIIDGLYLNDIKAEIDYLNKDKLDQEIEEKVFPYTRASFAKIQVVSVFKVESIKKAKYEEVSPNNKIYFSTDSGLLVLIAEQILTEFVRDFDYEVVVDTITDDINYTYWKSILSKYNLHDIGLILAPGINSGYEFEGSGIYKVEI